MWSVEKLESLSSSFNNIIPDEVLDMFIEEICKFTGDSGVLAIDSINDSINKYIDQFSNKNIQGKNEHRGKRFVIRKIGDDDGECIVRTFINIEGNSAYYTFNNKEYKKIDILQSPVFIAYMNKHINMCSSVKYYSGILGSPHTLFVDNGTDTIDQDDIDGLGLSYLSAKFLIMIEYRAEVKRIILPLIDDMPKLKWSDHSPLMSPCHDITPIPSPLSTLNKVYQNLMDIPSHLEL